MNIQRGLKRVGLVCSVALGLIVALLGVSSALEKRAAKRHWHRVEKYRRDGSLADNEASTGVGAHGRAIPKFELPSVKQKRAAELTAIDRSFAVEAGVWILVGVLVAGVAYAGWALTLWLLVWIVAGFTVPESDRPKPG